MSKQQQKRIDWKQLERMFYLHGKLVQPRDKGLKYCSIRPNYIETWLESGDYRVTRVWTNKAGKVKETVIYPSVGKADVELVIRELTRQAQEHFAINLYQCDWQSYKKYFVVEQTAYDASMEIEKLETIYGFDANNNLTDAFARRLMTWYATSYAYDRDRHYDLMKVYEDVCEMYDKCKNFKDFTHTEESNPELYNVEAGLHNGKLYTLQFIREKIGKIKLHERMTGYYSGDRSIEK